MNWIEQRVHDWHTAKPSNVELHEYLGMRLPLYQKFIHGDPKWVLGIDEVGYGCWAGPLVVGAVLAPLSWDHPALRDSKEVKTMSGRANILQSLEAAPGARYFLRSTNQEMVDSMGVFKARLESFAALCKALQGLEAGTLIVIDGNIRVRDVEHVVLPGADQFVPQVMAAAMVAKVSRDTEMVLHAKRWPQYGFENHKGYHSAEHVAALQKYGPCPLHRRSVRPIRNLYESSTSGTARI